MKTHIKLSLLLLALLLPATATAYDFEVDGFYYNINGNEATVTYKGQSSWSANSYSGDVTIPSSVNYDGTTYNVTSIGEGAFSDCNGLTSITIPNSVTSIGAYAFYGCIGLINIQVENGHPKYDSRNNCNAIIERASNTLIVGCMNTTIPNSVTSIGNYAFSGCSSLTSITIPNSVTSIGAFAFSHCRGLTSIAIPNSVTSIAYGAFFNCRGLTCITIPSSVTFIGTTAFSSCTSLTNITIPNSVISIGGGAFSNCSGLTNITIPNSITEISNGMFSGCTGLTDITIPNSVTSIGDEAFYDCTSLTNINIPYSVTSIGGDAFYDCSGLTEITIPNSVISIGNGAFFGCTGLTEITIPNSVTSIGGAAFANCFGLTSITIPNSVSSIGKSAFSNCRCLTDISIPNSVTFIGGDAFEGTSWFNNQPDGLVYAGSVAYKYKGIMPYGTSITLKEGTLSISDKAFENCDFLTNIEIPNSVIYIGEYAFSCCYDLTSITIPNSVMAIGEYAFLDCYWLNNVTIANSVKTIGEGAFSYCCSLTSITIPNSVTSIGSSAFYGCSSLINITIPNSVTTIGDWAFEDCGNLTTLFLTGEGEWTAGVLPSTATILYFDNGITGLKGMKEKPVDVFSFAVRPPVCDENSFTDYSGTLHVPAASIAAYFIAPYWCNFANIVGDAVKPNGLSLDKDSIELIIDESATLVATISPASAASNVILWTSSNPGMVDIHNGQVTAWIGPGECDIVAMCLDQRAVCHVTVYNDRISVDQEQLHVQPNHIVALTPTSLADELPALIVTSSDPTVAAARVMNGKVQVVGVSEGTATITVSATDGTAKPATCLVTVYTEQGDTNGDGYIDIDDVTALIEGVLGNEATSIKEKNADLNDDGIMDIDDVTALINTILGNN